MENIRRVAEVAKLLVDAGLIVVVAFIRHTERSVNSRVISLIQANLSKFSSIHRWKNANVAMRRDCMRRRGEEN